jgi:hypothetical protein
MFMISCGKDGSTGPAGTNGTDGTDGAAGPAGPAGPAGAGSATVIYSDWLDVPFKPDTIHTAGGKIDTVGFYAIIDAPKLTLALLSTADVKVYINTDNASDPQIYPLPYNARSGLYIDVTAYTQKIQLYSNSDVGTALGNDGTKYQQYRYMIVPGNTGARSAAQVNWSDYAAVKAYLGLKD